MGYEFEITPCMMCACGKRVRAMTEEERREYDDALRKLAEEMAKGMESSSAESTESAASRNEEPD